MEAENKYWFKGDTLENLYRIEATLTSISPLHIGTGQVRKDEMLKIDETDEDTPEIAEIERDYRCLPYLPGSALRGVVRHYLYSLFSSFDKNIASEPEFDKESKFREMNQDDQKEYIQTEASLLEQVFGTPFCESKVEFWDAPSTIQIDSPKFAEKGWNHDLQSYVFRSVAIDPLTGAAAANKLYSFDVAPVGQKYKLTIIGRNLSDEEMGFLLLGLEGFNSPIYPLSIGAMIGRGFGRMKFELDGLYRLNKDNIKQWLSLASEKTDAGYQIMLGLGMKKEDQINLIKKFKTTFIKSL